VESKISKDTRREIIGALRTRYSPASRREKSRILDEFVALSGCHRKYAIRLLAKTDRRLAQVRSVRRIYDEAVRQALVLLWEAADRICAKRLKAILPSLTQAMERHNHLALDPGVRQRLLRVSAATIDRLLGPIREKARSSKRRRRRSTKPSTQVPVRTFADWDTHAPGFLEIDFVAHCGGSMAGEIINSLVTTDVFSGWTEAVPLLAREQTLVIEALKIIRRRMPIPVLGLDSDNDSAFINDSLVAYCQEERIELTRSRAYRKNDQAWVEQKNGAVIRRFVGYDRFAGVVAGQTLANLFQALRL